MVLRILKVLFIFITFLYHSSVFSKSTENNNFNQRYLSNYFSALVSYENGDNDLALKYFDSTKNILRDRIQKESTLHLVLRLRGGAPMQFFVKTLTGTVIIYIL